MRALLLIIFFLTFSWGAGTGYDYVVSINQSSSNYETNLGGSNQLSFTITLTSPDPKTTTIQPGDSITVHYESSDIDAVAGVDYVAVSGEVTFSDKDPIGSTRTITVDTIGDNDFEPHERFNISLSIAAFTKQDVDSTASIGLFYPSSDGVILNDDGSVLPRLRIDSTHTTEGTGGWTNLIYTVTLDVTDYPLEGNATVAYKTQDISAKSSLDDYNETNGTLTFTPSSLVQTFSVPIFGDDLPETNEVLYGILHSQSSNVDLEVSYGYGTVIDDDGNETTGCSRFRGSLTINEYHHTVNTVDIFGNTLGDGEFIEVKILDPNFTPDNNWSIVAFSGSGAASAASFTFASRDTSCDETEKFLIFDFSNNKLSQTKANVVIYDDKGREVDYFDLRMDGDTKAPYYASTCQAEYVNPLNAFPYDTTATVPNAGAKDLYRLPDGVGDWEESDGTGANSGTTRCWDPGSSTTGILDAVERSDFTPDFSNYRGQIRTKLAGANPSNLVQLKLIALNETQTAYQDLNFTTQVWLGKKNPAGGWEKEIPLADVRIDGVASSDVTLTEAHEIDIPDFLYDARKDMKLLFLVCDLNDTGTYTSYRNCEIDATKLKLLTSYDNFAIRPEAFSFSLSPANTVAGKEFLQFVNTNPVAAGYTTTLDNSFFSLSDPKGCNTISDYNLSSPLNFIDGLQGSYGSTFHDVTQDMNLTLTDNQWTAVDQNGNDCILNSAIKDPAGKLHGCNIEGNVTLDFNPDDINITQQALNNGQNNFTYMANLPNSKNIAARSDISLRVESFTNALLPSFRSGCYAEDIILAIDLNTSSSLAADKNFTLQESNNSSYLQILDLNSSNQTLSYKISAAYFLTSELNDTMLFNINRETDKVLSPLTVKANNIYPRTASNSADGAITPYANDSVTFLYGRSHAPRYRINGDTGTFDLFYEAYCKDSNCTASYGLGSESPDDVYWYLNINHNNETIDGDANRSSFSGTNAANQTLFTDAIPSFNNAGIKSVNAQFQNIGSIGYPFTTKVSMNPDPWLIYNKYDSNALSNSFVLEFYKSSTEWSGAINNSGTVDSNASKTTNRRINW